MWRVKDLVIKPATLDFTSSGQGFTQISQLYSEQTLLINAIELVDLNDDQTQAYVCKACEFIGCQPGNWISVRTSGTLFLILPAVEFLIEEVKDEEYRPPRYIMERGVPYFDSTSYNELRRQNASFPPIEMIRPLTIREAMMLFQWEAPARVLGNPPEVGVRHREIVVGSSEGSADEQLERLEAIIRNYYDDASEALLRPLSEDEQPVSLYLDAEQFIEWNAIAFDGRESRLLLDSSYVIANG